MGLPSPWVVGVMVVAVGVAVGGASTDPTPELQTEAPPPRHDDGLVEYKGCPVYVLGVLKGMRKHGEEWLNDGSDCEICKCTDGQKRCYYHYCNSGVTEGYMTPPSAKTPADRPPLDDEDDQEEEGSGARPDNDPVEQRESSKVPGKDHKNPIENETHEQLPDDFCGHAPCKKACPHGYKFDVASGCRKCKCQKCQPLRQCFIKCHNGYAVDKHGCKTCRCREAGAKVSVISTPDKDFILGEGYGVSSEMYHDSDTSYSEVAVSGGVYVTADDDKTDPPCNTTGVVGCLDGRGVYAVGTWWERGPCETCTCKAPGYTECIKTHCARLPCPAIRHAVPEGACCPVCLPEPTRTHQSYYGRGESRSTSRVPLDRMPPPPTLSHSHHESQHTHHTHDDHQSRPHEETLGDGSTTKSAVQASPADWSQLCLIVVPVLVVFGMVGSLALHFWRRYHQDKYDINAYRPDETEKLRPVKTVDDTQPQPVRHV